MRRASIDSLHFESLNFKFDHDHVVFSDLTAQMPMNDVVWFRGSSGSGRSTVLQIMAGLISPQTGSYKINGQAVAEMSFEEFLPYRLNIGYSFDMGGLLSNRTIYENLILPLLYHNLVSPKEAHDRAMEMLTTFSIVRFKDLRPTSVSGGTKKLVCVLRALIHEPQMLLLDDPNIGLSADAQTLVVDRILEMKKSGLIKHIYVCSFDDRFTLALTPVTLELKNHGINFPQTNQVAA